jgi:outer membrane immunogenic protein
LLKNLVLGAVASLFAFLIAVPSASAAAVGPALAPIDWSGPYWGITGGAAWGQSIHTDNNGATSGDFDLHGGLLGVQGGYNWVVDAWVIGVEADASLSTLKGTKYGICSLGCTTDLRWLGTLRGRAGYSIGKFLPYVTAGLATGEVKAETLNISNSETRVGWTAGAGIAYAFTTGFSIKAEYLYTDLGHVNVPTPVPLRAKADDIQAIRVGLNFAF